MAAGPQNGVRHHVDLFPVLCGVRHPFRSDSGLIHSASQAAERLTQKPLSALHQDPEAQQENDKNCSDGSTHFSDLPDAMARRTVSLVTQGSEGGGVLLQRREVRS